MHIECWIIMTTYTLRNVYNTYCFSAVTVVRRTRLYVTFMRTLPLMLNIIFASIFFSSICNLYFSAKIRHRVWYVQNSGGIQYFGKRVTTE